MQKIIPSYIIVIGKLQTGLPVTNTVKSLNFRQLCKKKNVIQCTT